jgi:hypothetical protein
VIELCEVDRYVADKAATFGVAQAAFNRARDALDAELYAAFHRLCPCKAGDRVAVSYSYNGRTREMEGRAVIMRNGTRLGLYVDVNGQRVAVAEPYAGNVRVVKRQRH